MNNPIFTKVQIASANKYINKGKKKGINQGQKTEHQSVYYLASASKTAENTSPNTVFTCLLLAKGLKEPNFNFPHTKM